MTIPSIWPVRILQADGNDGRDQTQRIAAAAHIYPVPPQRADLSIDPPGFETRVAIVENGVLQEVFIERANKRGLVGNIYKGRA